jgi:hypothetical protein
MSLKRQAMRISEIRYRLKTPAFEFVFQWVLGMQTHGGSEVSESFYAASLVSEMTHRAGWRPGRRWPAG